MGSDTPFKCVIDALRPLTKGKEKLGLFAAGLIDMGLRPEKIVSGGREIEQTALDIVKSSTWKAYANGSRAVSEPTASEITGRWEPTRFAENFVDAYEKQALIDTAALLHQIAPAINKGNVGSQLGVLLYNVFKQAAGHADAVLPAEISSIIKLEQQGIPFIHPVTGKLHLVEEQGDMPERQTVPEEIAHSELTYVKALTAAYCEALGLQAPDVKDIPSEYTRHFAEQRKAFYSAEWAKDVTWHEINDGRSVYDAFLEHMDQGVMDTYLFPHPNGMERLLKTLTQATNLPLDGVSLAQIHNLVTVWVRKGACHQLVNQNRFKWVR